MKNSLFTSTILTLCLIHAVSASDILVVVDSSGSMQEATSDGVPRIEAAKSALLALPPDLSDHEVGIMLFGHRKTPKETGSCQDIEVTLPIAQFSEAQYKLTVAALRPRGATPIANALQVAMSELLKRDKDTQKSVILVTDGNETCGGRPVEVAAALQRAGFNIKVHVVGFDVNQQQEIQLKEIAAAGGGEYVLARNARELSEALPNVVKSVLRTTTVENVANRQLFNETFENEDLSDRWKVIRPDDERLAAVDGELLIVSQYSEDYDKKTGVGAWHNNGKTMNLLQSLVPINANDYEVAVDLDFQTSSLGQGASLQLRKDDENAIELSLMAHPWGNNIVRRLSMNKIINGQVARVDHRLAIGSPQTADKLTLKIVKRGAVYTGYARIHNPQDGNTDWREIGQQAAPGFVNLFPTLKAANGWNNYPEATATFDNFVAIENQLRRTIENPTTDPVAYRTVFDDVEAFANDFDTDKGFSTHFGINQGLNLVSQSGQRDDDDVPLKNMLLMKQELPTGNYEIEIQAKTRLTSQNGDLGIALYESEDKALYFGHAAFGGGGYNYNPQFQFEKMLKGKRTGAARPFTYLRGKETTVIFKIVKQGRKYQASVYAPDQEHGDMKWFPVGEQSLLKFNPKLAFYAWNRSAGTYGGGPAHEVNICFEQVTIRELD